MSEIAKAYVQIVPSARGMKAGLSGIFNSEMPSAGKSAGNSFGSSLISTVKRALVAAGIGKAITDSIMTGSDFEQLKGGMQKIFDEMDTSTIMADAANAYKDLNMSANQYLATINDVGATFSATMGDEKGYSVAKMGLQAISDYASGTGKNVDLLSEKFTMITRSTSSYQSIADQFSGILPATSAGFLEQAQAAGILSGKYKKLTEVPVDEYQQAVAEMLKKGTAELGLAGNTAEETATTFAGSMAAMKAAYSNFIGALAVGEDIGESLNVLGETVFTFVSGNLMPMVGNILSELPTVLDSAFGMAIRGLNLVGNNADTIVQMGIDLVTGIGSSIITAAPYLVEAAFGVVSALGNTIISTDWKQVATDTITAMRLSLDLAAGEILGTDGNIVKSVLTAISNVLPSILKSGVNIVVEIAEGLLSELPAFLETAGSMMNQLVDTFLSIAPSVWSSGITLIEKLASGLLSNLPAILSAGAKILAEFLATIASHLPDLLAQGIALVGKLVAGIIQSIPSVISAAGDIIKNTRDAFSKVDWRSIGSNLISGIVRGIRDGMSAVISAAKQVAQSALNAAKKALGIESPSRRGRFEVGRQYPAGIALGIRDNAKLVYDAVDDIGENMIASSLRIGNAKLSKSGLAAGYGKVVSVVQNIYSEAKTAADLMQEARYQQELAVMFGV